MAQFWDVYGASAEVPCVMDLIPGQYHADILVGISTVDVSPYINQALSQYRVVRLPLRGQLSVGATLRVPTGGGIYGCNYQCVIKALPNFGDNPVVQNAFTAPTSNPARDRNITLSGFTIDGNRDYNNSASQFSHGVKLYAVDGCTIDLVAINCKGDGLCVQYADWPHMEIGCNDISGRIRTRNNARHGVAIVCGEQINLDITDENSKLLALDIEPDDPLNIIRNSMFRVLSRNTGDGSEVSGGFCCAGDGRGCLPTNVTIDFEVHESGGYGGLWRDVVNLTLRGSIHKPKRGGLVGLDGGIGPSTIYFDGVRVFQPFYGGLVARETVGSVYDGSIYISGAGSMGAQIENARGGLLTMRVENGGQQGVYLKNCANMIFPNLAIDGNSGTNLWLTGGSSGNRFPGLRSIGSGTGYGFLEDAGCNDNKATQVRMSGNGGGAVKTSGAASYVMPEA